MLIDYAEITVRGGRGGAGVPNKPKGPDGGNGGDGGDVYVKGSSNLNLLNQFSEKDFFYAPDGEIGARNNKTGKGGDDIEILLPIGTSVIDKNSGDVIAEISAVDERLLVCKGGKGGWGGKTAKQGEKGEERKLILNLRLIADFGLIGLPNAGKSSLLNEITNANIKVADYPFTTLEPNLGVYEGLCLADIPGLIEGASSGKGLGINFLKHIEKVKVLLHCISCETSNALKDYETIRFELSQFNSELANKPEVIVLTKTDLVTADVVKKITKELNKSGRKIVQISIHDFKSLENFKELLRKTDISLS
jgi:GTP-binding protein